MLSLSLKFVFIQKYTFVYDIYDNNTVNTVNKLVVKVPYNGIFFSPQAWKSFPACHKSQTVIIKTWQMASLNTTFVALGVWKQNCGKMLSGTKKHEGCLETGLL